MVKDLSYTDERRHDNRLILFLQKENRFKSRQPVKSDKKQHLVLLETNQLVVGKHFYSLSPEKMKTAIVFSSASFYSFTCERLVET